jgi:hypothetical protein
LGRWFGPRLIAATTTARSRGRRLDLPLADPNRILSIIGLYIEAEDIGTID